MTEMKSIPALYPPDNASFLRQAALCRNPSSLSICLKQEMRPDVKHDSALTWDLLVARPLSACISNKQRTFNLKKDCYFVKLSYPSHYPPAPLICHSELPPLLFVCLTFLFCFLCSSVLDRMMWKQSIRLSTAVAGSLHWPKTLKCGESNFDPKSWGLLRSGTWPEKSGCCGETQHDRSCTFLSLRQGKVFSRVLALTLTTTPMYGQRDCQHKLVHKGKILHQCPHSFLVCHFLWLLVFKFLLVAQIHSATTPKCLPCISKRLDRCKRHNFLCFTGFFTGICYQRLRIATAFMNRHILTH